MRGSARNLRLLARSVGETTSHSIFVHTQYGRQMSTRAFRIKVRGEFKGLTPDQRADLLARASEHDALGASFKPEGHLSYDLAARPFFTFRFSDSGASDADLVAATERAEAAAAAWLDERGLAFRLLKSQAEDLSQAPMGKKQRRSEVARSEVARSEVARSQVARYEVARPEVARPQVARPEGDLDG
jgi:Family of unknown function (DUF6204)